MLLSFSPLPEPQSFFWQCNEDGETLSSLFFRHYAPFSGFRPQLEFTQGSKRTGSRSYSGCSSSHFIFYAKNGMQFTFSSKASYPWRSFCYILVPGAYSSATWV